MKAGGSYSRILILFLTILGSSIAAPDVHAYILTGIGGISKTNVSGTSSGDFTSNGVGWLFGGLVNITTSLGTGLESGFLLGHRKLTQTTGTTQLDVTGLYAEVPVEYLFRFSRQFFVSLGFYYAHYLSGTYNAHNATDASVPQSTSFTHSPNDFGALAGLGGEIPISAQSAIRIEGRFNAGFIPTNKTQEILFFMGLSHRF